jgi:hypothetical protein
MNVKTIIAVMTFLCATTAAYAGTFTSGSTGADGAFNPTTNTEVQLPADGVLNYTTVNIPSGVTVTFKKNANNTPVYILATGDVTISGTISVNGGSASSSTDRNAGSGGPGGYDGGYGGIAGMSSGTGGKGLGPGGRGSGTSYPYAYGGGGFGSVGGTYSGWGGSGGSTYGNSRLIPLIGGSGGGGGGGGAILIASSGNITIAGVITANGGSASCFWCGDCSYYNSFGGSGSGGGIRLIANTIEGSGTVSAAGGSRISCSGYIGAAGGSGRIRLEAYTNNFASSTTPSYSYGLPSLVFVSNIPSLKITSIAGTSVPSSPTASYSSPDIALPSTTTNPVTVALSASNIPTGTTVTVSVIPQQGSESTASTTLSGTDSSSTASASVNLSTGTPYVIMAWSTYTLQVAMYYEGEKIEKVRVATTMGRDSNVIYISESGKEISSEKLFAKAVQ